MKKILSFMILMLIVSVSFAQLNSNKPYTRTQSDARYERYLGNPSVSGYVLSSTTSGVRTWIANGGGSMVYPSAGIPLSTGSAWGTSITDNSVNWNTAYGWGNWAVNFGTTTGTITEGNDLRLSDARTPIAHDQAQSTITALPDSLLIRYTKSQADLTFVKKVDLVDPTSIIDSLTAITTLVDKTDNYTLQFSGTFTSTTNDLGKTITVTAATAKVITVPTNAVAPFPIGATITIIQGGTGDVSFAGSGIIFKSENSLVKIGAQEAAVQLIKIATDTWRIVGRLKA